MLRDKEVKLRLQILGMDTVNEKAKVFYVDVMSLGGYRGRAEYLIDEWCKQNGIKAHVFPQPGPIPGQAKIWYDLKIRIAEEQEATAFSMSWPHAK